MAVSAEIQSFFEEYARASNTLEAEPLERFFGDACLAAAPGFAAATTDRGQLRDALGHLVEFYRSIHRGEMQIRAITEQPIGHAYTFVTVDWVTTMPPAVDAIPFQVSYLVQRGDPMRIVAFVSHEDEQQMLKDRGIEV